MIKKKIIFNDFCEWTFDTTRAEGSFIWDETGRKLIDFTSGWNVTNLGWNHPEITEAMILQAKRSSYVPMWTLDPIQEKLAEELTKALPVGLNTCSRATGGTEANEEALKTARAYTGRKKILGFKDTYHGQSFGTLAIGYLPEYEVVKAISPLVPGFIQLDYPAISSREPQEKILSDFSTQLEEVLKNEDVAAVVTEAGIITGWGSTLMAPSGFLTAVRNLTKKYGTLLILDEVGTGFSRCGKLFGMEIEGVVPDIVTFAKGFSNGAAAIGAMVTTTEIGERTCNVTNLTSTFGWMPIACAASLKTLEIHQRDKVWEKAARDGDYLQASLREELKELSPAPTIRGIGMEIGVDFGQGRLVPRIVTESRKNGLHVVGDCENNLQIMPPLTIERAVLDEGIEILVKIIRSL
ncbi:MAG: aspartate aminotransferase family protein [Patescibacteria group bacterium]|nr:aspartate aminotransferase family protein [Patescibacteria group bacterium]